MVSTMAKDNDTNTEYTLAEKAMLKISKDWTQALKQCASMDFVSIDTNWDYNQTITVFSDKSALVWDYETKSVFVDPYGGQ